MTLTTAIIKTVQPTTTGAELFSLSYSDQFISQVHNLTTWVLSPVNFNRVSIVMSANDSCEKRIYPTPGEDTW